MSNDLQASVLGSCPDVGRRCIGAFNILRVLDPTTPTGVGNPVNGTYQVQVDFNVLAAGGINVTPGQTLHFQMFYRDDDYYDPDGDGQAECGPVNGSVKRWTESVSILLVP